MTDPSSIWEYCIHGLEHQVPKINDPDLQIFVDVVTKIPSNLNWFDKSKYPCVVFDQKRHTFDPYPILKKSNIPQLNLKLLLLGKRFVCGLCCLDSVDIIMI